MFSEVQVQLLQTARERINEHLEHFVCVAITTAVNQVAEFHTTYGDRFVAGRRLKSDIDYALDSCACFELWLFSETGIFPDDLSASTREAWENHAFVGWQKPTPREQWQNWCRLARVAWLDRVLEHGGWL